MKEVPHQASGKKPGRGSEIVVVWKLVGFGNSCGSGSGMIEVDVVQDSVWFGNRCGLGGEFAAAVNSLWAWRLGRADFAGIHPDCTFILYFQRRHNVLI